MIKTRPEQKLHVVLVSDVRLLLAAQLAHVQNLQDLALDMHSLNRRSEDLGTCIFELIARLDELEALVSRI